MSTVFVDLDETLVLTRRLDGMAPTAALVNAVQKSGGTLFYYGDQLFVVHYRPYVAEFLLSLRKRYSEINLLTAGERDFQTIVLTMLNLLPFFDKVYFREDIERDVPLCRGREATLIDNAPANSAFIRSKVRAIGCYEVNIITVPAWDGNPADQVLLGMSR